MSNARIATLVLLCSALGVVSCATWIEKREAPASAELAPEPAASPPPARSAAPLDPLAARRLLIPVKGLRREDLRDTFDEKRGIRRHHALDIMARRGTPVVAVDDGRVVRVRRHLLGGLTVYQYDPQEKYAYYYAHLDRYAKGLEEGRLLKRGDVIGYVGSTGNAPASAPHLHFAITEMDHQKRWFRGKPVNPYPYLVEE
ncbi:MAG TPA: M23 family metallopeptidase [Usitatibacter sp.]|nr:M23 family metallopeptidase [Usitatibacter sp.]